MGREQCKSIWLALEAEEGYEWYETLCENECNDCGRNVPKEEYDSSLGHCLECHGG